MKLGDVMFTKKFEVQTGFGRMVNKATYKAKDANTLLGYIYIGAITPDSAPHFSVDGTLAALGYGPIMRTLAQRRAVDALKMARAFVENAGDENLSDLAEIDSALAAVKHFDESSAPTIDPILLDAARFNALLDLLERKVGADVTLWSLLGEPAFESQGTDQRERLMRVIDAATKK